MQPCHRSSPPQPLQNLTVSSLCRTRPESRGVSAWHTPSSTFTLHYATHEVISIQYTRKKTLKSALVSKFCHAIIAVFVPPQRSHASVSPQRCAGECWSSLLAARCVSSVWPMAIQHRSSHGGKTRPSCPARTRISAHSGLWLWKTFSLRTAPNIPVTSPMWLGTSMPLTKWM